MENYVIVGNGTAAAASVEGIRSVDPEGSITVVSAEALPVYSRPLISYYLEGKTDPGRMLYRSEDFYEKNGCTVLYGKMAVKIREKEKRLLLDDGTALPYTKLLVAAGSSPIVPKIEGLDQVPEKFTFMTLPDAEALKERVKEDSRVLILGAGLIGLKCAEGLRSLTEHITVCDLADRVLSSILDKEGAALVEDRLKENGIRLLLSDTAERFESGEALTRSGIRVPFDVLVLAIGVRPNASLLRDIGGETDRGILVDECMRTSVEDVWAAGDCAEGTDCTDGKKRVLALLPNAYCQGFTAGVNMAGGDLRYDTALPMNSIGFFGLHLMTAGSGPLEDGEVYEEKSEGKIRKLFTKDGLLRGFILVGDTARAGIYTAMIRERVPLDSVDFAFLKKVPTSAAYPEKTRRKMFGGVV